MIVADSSVWIDFGRGRMTRQTRILFEAVATKQALAAFDELPQATIGGRDIAVAAARSHKKLRASGVTPRATIDVLIATFCIENGHALLHAHRDFDAMEKHLGLRTL